MIRKIEPAPHRPRLQCRAPDHLPPPLFALAFATRSALNCRPDGSRRSQHREQSGPRAPVWTMPQAEQIGLAGGGSRPA